MINTGTDVAKGTVMFLCFILFHHPQTNTDNKTTYPFKKQTPLNIRKRHTFNYDTAY